MKIAGGEGRNAPLLPARPHPHTQVTSSLAPTRLEIHNDSHLHRHHAAMADSTSAETHFRLVVASDRFRGLAQIRRHRMVNDLLREDLARQGGIHALQLRTMTPEEDEKRRAQEQEQEQEQEQGQQQQQKEEQKEQQG